MWAGGVATLLKARALKKHVQPLLDVRELVDRGQTTVLCARGKGKHMSVALIETDIQKNALTVGANPGPDSNVSNGDAIADDVAGGALG